MQDYLAAAAELKSYTFIEVTHTSELYQDTIGRARLGGRAGGASHTPASLAAVYLCTVAEPAGTAGRGAAAMHSHCGDAALPAPLPSRGTLEGKPAELLRADTSRARRASAGSWLLATPRAAEAEGVGGRRRAAAAAAASRGRPGLKRLRGAAVAEGAARGAPRLRRPAPLPEGAKSRAGKNLGALAAATCAALWALAESREAEAVGRRAAATCAALWALAESRVVVAGRRAAALCAALRTCTEAVPMGSRLPPCSLPAAGGTVSAVMGALFSSHLLMIVRRRWGLARARPRCARLARMCAGALASCAVQCAGGRRKVVLCKVQARRNVAPGTGRRPAVWRQGGEGAVRGARGVPISPTCLLPSRRAAPS